MKVSVANGIQTGNGKDWCWLSGKLIFMLKNYEVNVSSNPDLPKYHKKLPWRRACTPDKIKRSIFYVEKNSKCANSKKGFSKFQLITSYLEGDYPLQMKQIEGYSLCKKQ